jgi:hypothetical protein
MFPNVKLMRCRGAFQTCEICNNANLLLRDAKRRFTKEQRQMILKFKAMHISQQAQEVQNLSIEIVYVS